MTLLAITWRACYHETANASAPITWMQDFAEARYRLRDWVAISGTRLDRDRPTRQTTWPGEPTTEPGAEVPIFDRRHDFEKVVRIDLARRRTAHSVAQRATG